MTYQVRYGQLRARDIVNLLEMTPAAIQRKATFYNKLEHSILREGFRNPILVVAGYCPTFYGHRLPSSMQMDRTQILVCFRLGGSRLYVAQKHDLMVPCVISDFVGRFPDLEHLPTVDAVADKFKERPDWIRFLGDGVYTAELSHTHLY